MRCERLSGLGRLAIPKDKPEEGRLLDGLRITQDSHKVNIHIEEPEELVESLVGILLGSGTRAGEIDHPPEPRNHLTIELPEGYSAARRTGSEDGRIRLRSRRP